MILSKIIDKVIDMSNIYSFKQRYFNKQGYRKHLPGTWKSKWFWKRYCSKYIRRSNVVREVD